MFRNTPPFKWTPYKGPDILKARVGYLGKEGGDLGDLQGDRTQDSLVALATLSSVGRSHAATQMESVHGINCTNGLQT